MSRLWHRYKYRFTPFAWMSWRKRAIQNAQDLSPVCWHPAEVLETLEELFGLLQETSTAPAAQAHQQAQQIMKTTYNFSISVQQSSIPQAGNGVVLNGKCPKGQLVALYPGLVYQPHHPILFQSINNSFIFRCSDSVLIDGKNTGLSRSILRSCVLRDSWGPGETHHIDLSWLTPTPRNPLAVGQIVNNRPRNNMQNVMYVELDLPATFPLQLRHLCCNAHYASSSVDSPLRIVALLATRDIEDEELFSSYFSMA
eukprot:m.32461 g.32461  ORF g.32461 m.32461 type:complete len:255 (+) comp14972_c0_seq1:157-921(+)